MLKEIHITKKIPRLLLAHAEPYLEAIPGVEILWPDRSFSAVYDLSLSGFYVDARRQLGAVKMDQLTELRLKLPTLAESIPFKVRLVKMQGAAAGFVFENMGLENRLTLEQSLKDQIVTHSLKEIPVAQLPVALRGSLWLHGAFDTNLLLWFSSDSRQIEKAIVESDNLIWKYEAGSVSLLKTLPTILESQEYLNAAEIVQASGRKVSMGASWMERLMRVLELVNERRGGDLSGLLILMRHQRAH